MGFFESFSIDVTKRQAKFYHISYVVYCFEDFFRTQNFLWSKIFCPTISMDSTFFWTQNSFPNFFSDSKFFRPQIVFWSPHFFYHIFFGPKILLAKIFVNPKLFSDPKFLWTHSFYWPKKILYPIFVWDMETRDKAFPSWTL